MQSKKYWTKFQVIGTSKNGVFSHGVQQKSANYRHAKVTPMLMKYEIQILSRSTETIIVLERGNEVSAIFIYLLV